MRRWIERIVTLAAAACLLAALVWLHLDLELVRRGPGGALVWNRRVLGPLALGLALLAVLGLARLGHMHPLRSLARWRALLRSVWTAACAIAIAVFVNLIAAEHPVRLDVTARARFTLDARSRQVLGRLASLPQPLTAYVFVRRNHPWLPTLRGLLESYVAAAGGRMRLEVLDPARDLLRFEQLLQQLGIEPRTLRSSDLVLLVAPPVRAGSLPRVRQIPLAAMATDAAALGDSPRLHAFRGEEEITRALLALTRRRQPRVVLLRGHREFDRVGALASERIERACRLLESLDYAIETLQLDPVRPDASRLPEEGDVLWIAAARDPLTAAQASAIAAWLERGGRLLVLAEPVIRQQPGTTERRFVPLGLDPVLRRWGIGLLEAIVVDPATVTPLGPLSLRAPVRREPRMHPIVAPLAGLELWFDRARPLALSPAAAGARGGSVAALIGTYETARVITDPGALGPSGAADEAPAGAWILAAAAAAPATATAAAGRTGVAETRIVAVGDASWCADALLAREPSHAEFLINAVGWLSEREELISIAPRPAEIIRLRLDRREKLRLWLFALLDLPGLFVVTGLLVRRTRRR